MTIFKILVAISIAAVTSGQCFGEDLLATQLGDVLASEQPCGFSYDQSAISTFLQKNVQADDKDFAHDLDLKTWVRSNSLEKMTTSSKTAYCFQEGRVAKTFGLMK